MSDQDIFSRCFGFTVGAEGGYSVNAADPGNWTGGAIGKGELNGTKYGISAASYPTLAIVGLTAAAAEAIYRRDYWSRIMGDQLPLPVALTAFDAAVNTGTSRAVRWLQQAVDVQADGVFGAATLAAVAAADATAAALESLSRRLDFMARLPGWSTFGLGWSRRMILLAKEIAA